KYEPWGPYDREETVQMLENIIAQLESGLCTEWAVERKEDAKVLGLVHLNKVDFFHRSAEIGYWLSRKCWGRGYATEGVRALTEYAIKTLRMDEIIAVCHPENAASLRVLEKIGMKYQKDLPRYISLRGKTADCLQYHITRWDFM
ncbi:MAG: GNAT family N-acetyltransferase, partial [Clostridia bacterium]|nr:GNAT family N-acetyltransferase [Clostridia bacterium]